MANIDGFHRANKMQKWPIVLLRIYTGVFFLKFGFSKITRDDFADGVGGFLTSQLDSSFGFYRPVVENVILPNKAVFAFLVAWGELFLGVALILGLATRYAAFAGAFMVANFWFAKGQGILDAQNHDIIWLVILVVLGALHAGRSVGLDELLAKRFPFLD